MRYWEIRRRSPKLTAQLLRVWESSVKATHSFLSENEIENIKRYVPRALREVPHLIVAGNDGGSPVAFAGVNGRKLEMLFVSAESRGRGIGGRLLRYAVDAYAVNELAVNEQNPLAVGFTNTWGFGRTDGQRTNRAIPIRFCI